MSNDVQTPEPSAGLSARNVTPFVYILQAVAFFFPPLWIVAVIVNYVKIDDVRGTWLESHFRWQIRTFWFGLLWAVIGAISFIILVGWFVLAANYIWMIYRVVKGWLDFNGAKPMYRA
jgi:uncharacterized membrane protein